MERQSEHKSSFEFLTPHQAWEELDFYRRKYYRKYAAPYSGKRSDLSATSERGLFWNRPGKAKIHVPLAADIAATSADLLFGEEPRFTCYDEKTEDGDTPAQQRLDELVEVNGMHGKLNEAAESASALGDIYLKLNWDAEGDTAPGLTVVQPDSAWPEYLLGRLKGIHFFSLLKYEQQTKKTYRVYELYTPGMIYMKVFCGDDKNLGSEVQNTEYLAALGFESEIKPPIDDMLAVHIPNIRPNRAYRDLPLGRSDYDGLRGLMDSLDETMSSWIRDVRLAKARTIVAAEYLRRKSKDMFKDGEYTYEFDEDVETLVALDINPETPGANGLTLSQFAIRANEHLETCKNLIRDIVTTSGYSPQTFGIDIQGSAESGTALHIREKKSFSTCGKKQAYWTAPLQKIMTAMLRLDAKLYNTAGVDADVTVSVHFADNSANDISTVAQSLHMLHSAQSASIEVRVRMLHPDWNEKKVMEEVERIKDEYGLGLDLADPMYGDFAVGKKGQNPDMTSDKEDKEDDA